MRSVPRVIEEQDEDQLGHGADHRRVDFQQVAQDRPAIKLAEGAADADEQPEDVAADRQFEGGDKAG